jgi:cobalt-zinc-cadmium efflux system outer membrane protein
MEEVVMFAKNRILGLHRLSLLPMIVALFLSAEARSEDELILSDLVQEVQEVNPEIMASRANWQAAETIIRARGALPDPQFSYTYFIENVETRVGPQRNILGLKQTFPFYGKRDLRAEVAQNEANALKEGYGAVRRRVIQQIKKAYYELFYIQTAIDITHDEKGLLKRYETIARTKYETGVGNQQDILKVQVEITNLNDRLLSLGSQRQMAEATINTLLNQPPDQPLGRPIAPKIDKMSYSLDELLEMAEDNRQEVRAASAIIERNREAYRLAKRDYFPDLTLGVNYFDISQGPLPVADNGNDAWNVVFTINLPIWYNKLSSQVESALEGIRVSQKSRRDTLNLALFEVKDNHYKLITAQETIDLYENALIPQAKQSLKSAEAGYIAGRASFLDLLDAERVLLKIEYGYWRAVSDYAQRRADLERAVGVDLNDMSEKQG